MTPAGLKDVAREAGVSVAAVSQAVHGKGRLAPATRARILAVADRLGYVAHPGASALVRGRSHVLALSMPELEHFPELAGVIRHFLGILGGAAGAALEHDHALVAAPGGATSPVWKRVAYDGAVVVEPRAGEPVLAMLRRRGIPVVTIGHEPGAPDANPCADNDVPAVTREALDHLAGDGDGDVALMLAEPLFSTETQSVAAYERWCAERGAAPRVVVAANPGPDAVAEAAAATFAPGAPRAIYALLDRLGVAAQLEARRLGLRVGDDVRILALSDSDLARDHDLSAIDERPAELGRAAVELLVRGLGDDEGVPRRILVPTDLIARGSSPRPGDAGSPRPPRS